MVAAGQFLLSPRGLPTRDLASFRRGLIGAPRPVSDCCAQGLATRSVLVAGSRTSSSLTGLGGRVSFAEGPIRSPDAPGACAVRSRLTPGANGGGGWHSIVLRFSGADRVQFFGRCLTVP